MVRHPQYLTQDVCQLSEPSPLSASTAVAGTRKGGSAIPATLAEAFVGKELKTNASVNSVLGRLDELRQASIGPSLVDRQRSILASYESFLARHLSST